ncbi:hypothetical protein [Martelella soudanensis]|uniref:hypothetical protein n=1 Tax=unclassified Martelella TaxID=2629616 RepID=UPI0015DEC169|nr:MULTISPECIES: hypothetical protein [unclassified Martelella]
MTFNIAIRQFHRWSSIIFIGTVIVAMVAASRPEPAEWVFYLPLLPLILMLLTGLYLFALPYMRETPGLCAGGDQR